MKKVLLLIIIILLSMFFYILNNNKQTINIGFISSLSGKYSSVGHSVLNGFKLFLEENNYKVGNKNIKLIIEDDKQNPKEAKIAIDKMLKKDIKIIIGNTTSAMTKVSLRQLKNKDDVLLISPNSSSKEFSNKDDNFVRLQAEINPSMFDPLSLYLIKNDKKTIQIIYDSSNNLYSQDIINSLKSSYEEKYKGKITSLIKINIGYEKILKSLDNKSVIFIIANSLDSAKLIQFLRLNNIKQLIASSAWGKDYSFIQEGGKAVEGVLFCTGYNNNSKRTDYKKFQKKYMKKYYEKPSSSAIQSYETAMILYDALKHTTNPKKIKEYILNNKVYDGLQGKIEFNKYGDVSREYFLVEVKNQEFKIKK